MDTQNNAQHEGSAAIEPKNEDITSPAETSSLPVPPAPPRPLLKCFVSYVVATGTGQLFGALTLSGLHDILTEADVQNVQRSIATNYPGLKDPNAVALLFWKHLVA